MARRSKGIPRNYSVVPQPAPGDYMQAERSRMIAEWKKRQGRTYEVLALAHPHRGYKKLSFHHQRTLDKERKAMGAYVKMYHQKLDSPKPSRAVRNIAVSTIPLSDPPVPTRPNALKSAARISDQTSPLKEKTLRTKQCKERPTPTAGPGNSRKIPWCDRKG